MRLLPITLLLSTICFEVVAQVPKDVVPKDAAAKDGAAKDAKGTAAAVRYAALAEQQSARTKGLQRGDTKARNEMFVARATDLDGLVKEFPKSVEANKARLEIAQISMQNKDLAVMGKQALADFDVGMSDLKMTIQAAMAASTLGMDEQKGLWIDSAVAKAVSIDDRMEMVMALKNVFKDTEQADKLLQATETAAKTDEDKAAFMMGKTNMARRSAPKNQDEYQANLAEVAKQFPMTRAGRLAATKLAAASLKAGSDPVPFTAKDLDGKAVSPADYKGKVLLIDFWATWCGPCMNELPNVLETYGEYHDKGFEILGVSLDREGDLAKLQNVMKEKGMTWRQIYDGKFWQAEIAQLHDVQSIPYTILIGRDGKVIGTSLRGKNLGEAVKEAIEAK